MTTRPGRLRLLAVFKCFTRRFPRFAIGIGTNFASRQCSHVYARPCVGVDGHPKNYCSRETHRSQKRQSRRKHFQRIRHDHVTSTRFAPEWPARETVCDAPSPAGVKRIRIAFIRWNGGNALRSRFSYAPAMTTPPAVKCIRYSNAVVSLYPRLFLLAAFHDPNYRAVFHP